MRKRVAGLFTAAVVMGTMVVTSPVAVTAQTLNQQPFAAYGTGAALSVNALQLGQTQIANTQAAFSGGSVNSQGLNSPINNQFGQAVQPAIPGRNAYGRGTGLEVGLATPVPQNVDLNQILLTALAQAAAPPPSPLVTREIPINIPGLLSADTLRGQAQATYDPNFCPVGRPLTFGLGSAENLQLINPGPNAVLATNTPSGSSNANTVSQTRTVTFLIGNGDGTFGVVSEVRSIVAPVRIAGTGITIDLAGEFVLRAVATGKPNDPRNGIFYPGSPILTVRLNNVQLLRLSLQDILGQGGLNVPLEPIASLRLGSPPTGVNGSGAPAVAADGTSASAAVDVARLRLLNLPGLAVLDLALAHMETAVAAPAGGVRCNLPVSKTANPNPVQAGQDFTFTISIPSDAAFFSALFNCDLVNIQARDIIDVAEGNPSFEIVGVSNGGVVQGRTITFPNLGSYRLGDPPIQANIVVRVTGGTGVIRDTVDVSAQLGNCRGSATGGDDIVKGSGQIDGAAITGRFVLIGPQVGPGGGVLADTGGSSLPLMLGGGLVLGALGLLRVRRAVVRRDA